MRTAVPSRYPSSLSAGHRRADRKWEHSDDDSATGSVIGDYLFEEDEGHHAPASLRHHDTYRHRNRAVSPGVLMNSDMLFTDRTLPPPVPKKDFLPPSLIPNGRPSAS